MSIPQSPFNTFAYFKSEVKEAQYQPTPQTFELAKMRMQEKVDNCEADKGTRGPVEPWELPQDTTEIVELEPKCYQCYEIYDEDFVTYLNPEGFDRQFCGHANWHTDKESCEGATPHPDSTSTGRDLRNYENKWVTEGCKYVSKQHILKERQSNPSPMPSGWRVTSSGHLTNLPLDLDVTDRTDALKNGVYVITPEYTRFNQNWQMDTTSSGDPTASPLTLQYPQRAGALPNIPYYTSALPSWSALLPCTHYEINDMRAVRKAGLNIDRIPTENDCKNMNYIASSYHPRDTLSGTLRAVINTLKSGNYLDEFYWWVEAPLFAAACPDTVTPEEAAGKYDYWDKNQCKKQSNNSDDSTTSMATPVAIIGGVVAIIGATVYFGGSS